MTKVKIELKERPINDPLVVVCGNNKIVNIDYENTPGHGISMKLDDLPRFVDVLMFVHGSERSSQSYE